MHLARTKKFKQADMITKIGGGDFPERGQKGGQNVFDVKIKISGHNLSAHAPDISKFYPQKKFGPLFGLFLENPLPQSFLRKILSPPFFSSEKVCTSFYFLGKSVSPVQEHLQINFDRSFMYLRYYHCNVAYLFIWYMVLLNLS